MGSCAGLAALANFCVACSAEDVEGRWGCRWQWRDPGRLQNGLEFAGADYGVYFRNVLDDFVAITLDKASGNDQFPGEPEVLKRAISRMVSTDSCLAVSMKLQVLTTRISASSGVP